MKFLIVSLGFVLSRAPECVLRGLCCFSVWVISTFMNSRMRIAYSNLSHCFPELSEKEIKAIAKESARRMIEMGMFVLASPHIKIQQLKKRIKVDDYILSQLASKIENPKPTVILVPHFCMMESITLMPALVDKKLPQIGVFYRPFDNQAIEAWVKDSRQRCGLNLLSRRKGTRVAIDFLRANGCIALLFDQNAGGAGSLGMFFNRICSTTELPRILAEHEKADVAVIFAKRTGFWRSEISGEYLEGDFEDINFNVNSWLAKKLSSDSELRKDWLWLHRRWLRGYTFSMPKFREGELQRCLAQSGGEFKRLNRIVITPPSSLRGTFALVPLLKALRRSRLDAKISLVCEKRFYSVLSSFNFVDEVICAPDSIQKMARLRFYKRLASRYFDLHVVLEDSLSADIQAKYLAASQTVAIQSMARRRLFIKDVYRADYASEAESLLGYYETFFRHYGLVGDIDLSALSTSSESSKNVIAVICGGKGNHAMSPQKWGDIIKTLDRKLDDAKFIVLGDEQDSRTAFDITRTAEYADIKTLAGVLDDSQVMQQLKSTSVAIGTDCRLTHIANALGCKVVAVYGQTNPIRNGLVFDAPKVIVRPKNSPEQGGIPVELVDSTDVAQAVLNLINQ